MRRALLRVRAAALVLPLLVAGGAVAAHADDSRDVDGQGHVHGSAQGWGCAPGVDEVLCPETVSFAHTGAEQEYVVPAGVRRLRVRAVGAGGGYGDGNAAPGGRGAVVEGTIPVTPGQVVFVHVGGPGQWFQDDPGAPRGGGFNGGGGATPGGIGGTGGGASDVRTVSSTSGAAEESLVSRLIVAGGGGGGGVGYVADPAAGGDAGAEGVGGGVGEGDGGGAGGATAGGAGGVSDGFPTGLSGVFGRGGDVVAPGFGGGGGGGWYGGGSGATGVGVTGFLRGAGGGGGSSLVPAGGTGPTPTTAAAQVVISALIAPGVTASSPPASWVTGPDPVTVSFVCSPGTAAIVDCPAPVTVSDEGLHTVAGTVTDADGATATATAQVRIDRTGPQVSVRGARDGMTYARHHRARCVAADRVSGVADCAVSHHTRKDGRRRVTTVTATATDRAGNQRVVTLSYAVRRGRTFLGVAPALAGVYQLQAGERYPLVVLTTGARPRAADPLTGGDLAFRRAGSRGDLVRWRSVLQPGPALVDGQVWRLQIAVGEHRRTLRFTKDRFPTP